MASELDQPRSYPDYHPDQWPAVGEHYASRSIDELDRQLRLDTYDPSIQQIADRMLVETLGPTSLDDDRLRVLASRLVAKARRERERLLRHLLTEPAKPFVPDDPLFDITRSQEQGSQQLGQLLETVPLRSPDIRGSSAYASLKEIVALFRQRDERRGMSASHIDEVGRAHRWLMEELGEDTPIDQITDEQVRTFRDNLERLDAKKGERLSFRSRLTDDPARQLRSDTALKHWNSIQNLFRWARKERRVPSDPTVDLDINRKKGEERRSPQAYSDAELRKLFETPLYQGYKSPNRLGDPGTMKRRNGHWWSALVQLFTGVRGGELTQLLVADFVFDHPVPHVKVREEDDEGQKVKSAKTRSSIRDVPLHPVLLELGLRQFVEQRAKSAGRKGQVFHQFRIGGRGKVSEGLSRFWGDYIRRFELHKPGRGTHVMRHTFTAKLKRAERSDEDIGVALGHKQRSITSTYGGDHPLERKAKVIADITTDFDLLSLLGGTYDPKIH